MTPVFPGLIPFLFDGLRVVGCFHGYIEIASKKKPNYSLSEGRGVDEINRSRILSVCCALVIWAEGRRA